MEFFRPHAATKDTLTFLRSGHGIEVLLTALEKPDRVWFGDDPRAGAATGSVHHTDLNCRQARHAPVRRRRDSPLGPAAHGDVRASAGRSGPGSRPRLQPRPRSSAAAIPTRRTTPATTTTSSRSTARLIASSSTSPTGTGRRRRVCRASRVNPAAHTTPTCCPCGAKASIFHCRSPRAVLSA